MRAGKFKQFPHYKQLDYMDCGATCLRIISKYYGKFFNLDTLRTLTSTGKEGTNFLKLSRAAETLGYSTFGAKVNFASLKDEVEMPCIAHWDQNHFIVIYKISKHNVYVSDPAAGLLKYSIKDFIRGWADETGNGVVLMLETTPSFFTQEDDEKPIFDGVRYLVPFFAKYKKYTLHIVLSLVIAGLIQLAFPFLTQNLIDKGVKFKQLDIVYLILFAQLFLFVGRTSIDVVRSWLIVHISSRINIAMVSGFFIKLMNLPLAFFDVKMNGDILQRLSDHKRIEQVVTSNSIGTLLSLFNLFLFGIVLGYYNTTIFFIFLFTSMLNFAWIYFFIKERKRIDYKKFNLSSAHQSKTIELINGMQEIKLNNAEKEKRWQWEKNQVKLFKNNIKGLTLDQYQSIGSSFINEIKNIIITVIAAKLVISGEITVGVLLSISYIIGQLNGPISQLVSFVQAVQDAKMSLERIAEIHNKEEENIVNKIEEVYNKEEGVEIRFEKVNFAFSGPQDKTVLKDISFSIPKNKVTAIVGASGSGKTTLVKLLLGFYKPTSGTVWINKIALANLKDSSWRALCGAVLQEGYIFSDTIERNITIGAENVSRTRLMDAVRTANISSFIEGLPLGLNTKIGAEGMGLSTGQKQRLLIARAIYKNPEVLFFDEATSALDSKNEREIVDNLDHFFNGRTVVIVAHRLSTIQYADQIVVMDEGEIKEVGSHEELLQRQSYYYNLVRNQLTLETKVYAYN